MSPLPDAPTLVTSAVGVTYIAAAVCFVLSLHWIEPTPALRRGQLFGALSMLLVSTATYCLSRTPEADRSVSAVLLAALLGLPLSLASLMSNGLEHDPAPALTLLSSSAAFASIVTFVMVKDDHLVNWASLFALVAASSAILQILFCLLQLACARGTDASEA